MENGVYLVVFILFLLAAIAVGTFKIYQFVQKVNKLYNYFIRSEKDLNGERIGFVTNAKGIPPVNGECPSKEELENANV